MTLFIIERYGPHPTGLMVRDVSSHRHRVHHLDNAGCDATGCEAEQYDNGSELRGRRCFVGIFYPTFHSRAPATSSAWRP